MLLNNLETRLDRYSTLLGRRAALWHGDVPTSQRRKILREPPDCLLTTPESLEVMLVSPRVESRRLFAGLQVVIIDEIHAFAGDDRGWHLLALLARIARLAGREFQRIGLSATVGNPDALLDMDGRVLFRTAAGFAAWTSGEWQSGRRPRGGADLGEHLEYARQTGDGDLDIDW